MNMKKEYIQPETELIVCRLSAILEGSDPNTEWTVGDDPIGGDGPNPEGGEAKRVNLWDKWE